METFFEYEGKQIPLFVNPVGHRNQIGLSSSRTFQLLINKIYMGDIYRDEFGCWVNLKSEQQDPKLKAKSLALFELQSSDYDIIGEQLEKAYPECF